MAEPRQFSRMQKLLILQRAGYCCESCSVALATDNFHADHRTPYSRGGETAFYNAQALCSTCNLKKGNRPQ